MILFFKKKGYLVKSRYIIKFLKWHLSSSFGLKNKLRDLISLIFFIRKSTEDQEKQYRNLSINSINLSWIKINSDGTKTILFNLQDSEISKISNIRNIEQLKTEITLQKKYDFIAPRILKRREEDFFFIEEWVKTSSIKTPDEDLILLLGDIYKRSTQEEISIDDYFNQLNRGALSKKILTECKKEIKQVKISDSHGDFWQNNILTNLDGGPLLVDWEYAGRKHFTYDLWFFIFQENKIKSQDKIILKNICSRFITLYQNLYKEKINMKYAQSISLLHLFERYSQKIEIDRCYFHNEIGYLEELIMNLLDKRI